MDRRDFLRRSLAAGGAWALRKYLPELEVDDVTLPARFPVRTLPVGPMPQPGPGVDAWDSVTTSLYSGPNPFSGVVLPTFPGRHLLRSENHLAETEKHATFGWPRDLPDGSESYLAFEVLWNERDDALFRGWSLVAQLQAKNGLSPVWAISNDKSDGHWFVTIRIDGQVLRIPLGPLRYGVLETFMVGCRLSADRHAGFVAVWHDDLTGAPKVRVPGATSQAATGHHTLGVYAERAPSGVLVAHYGRAGRAADAAGAIGQMELAA